LTDCYFNRNLISLKSQNQWPPHSPDLNPLDFFLWDYLKDRVDIPPPETTEDLKRTIQVEMRKITKETCTAVLENFRRRVKLVTEVKGRHLEHV